ncbi:hypothetical protein Q4489_17495, partial [Thalassotalea sp. 1_MG-2023]|uniref:hypothetical protein n=1 Tax=Thalassotalea sp. 1_MG-2023 TaxID=3062680 RepID=UPI0026E14BEA
SLVYSGMSRSRSQSLSDGNYSYKVRACNGSLCGSFTEEKTIEVSNPLDAPTGLSAPNTSSTGLFEVSWNAVSGATSYLLERNGQPVYSQSNLSYQESLDVSGTYRYKVKACSGEDICSALSEEVSVVVTITSDEITFNPEPSLDGSFVINWLDLGFNTKYEVWEKAPSASGFTKIGYNLTQTSLSLTGKTSGSWGYRIEATICAENSTQCASKTLGPAFILVTQNTPSIPIINAPNSSDNGIYTVSWSTPDTDVVDYYELYRNGELVTLCNDVEIQPLDLSCQEEQVNGTYTYYIKACAVVNGESLCSVSSNKIVEVTIPFIEPPLAPSIVESVYPVGVDVPIQWPVAKEGYSLKYYYTSGPESALDQSATNEQIKSAAQELIGGVNHRTPGYYWFLAKYCNTGSQCSDYSDHASVLLYGKPGIPINIVISSTTARIGGKVNIDWQANNTRVGGYYMLNITSPSNLVRSIKIAEQADLNDFSEQTPVFEESGLYLFSIHACHSENLCSESSSVVEVTVTSGDLAYEDGLIPNGDFELGNDFSSSNATLSLIQNGALADTQSLKVNTTTGGSVISFSHEYDEPVALESALFIGFIQVREISESGDCNGPFCSPAQTTLNALISVNYATNSSAGTTPFIGFPGGGLTEDIETRVSIDVENTNVQPINVLSELDVSKKVKSVTVKFRNSTTSLNTIGTSFTPIEFVVDNLQLQVVDVKPILYVDNVGNYYLKVSSDTSEYYLKLSQSNDLWLVENLTKEQWQFLDPENNFTDSGFIIEFGEFTNDSYEDIKLVSPDGRTEVVLAQNEDGGYQPIKLRKILFIHTDVLGTPVAETDENGVIQ